MEINQEQYFADWLGEYGYGRWWIIPKCCQNEGTEKCFLGPE